MRAYSRISFYDSFSDELSSRDPKCYGQADGNYPGSSSTNPSYPGQISLLMITFCPPSFPTEHQLEAVFLGSCPRESRRAAGCCSGDCCAAPPWELQVSRVTLLSQMIPTYTIQYKFVQFFLKVIQSLIKNCSFFVSLHKERF